MMQYCQLSPNKSAILNYGNRERAAIVDDVVAPLTERELYTLLRVRTSQGWQFIEGACVEAVKIRGREQGYEDLIDALNWYPYDQRKLFQTARFPWAAVLDCIALATRQRVLSRTPEFGREMQDCILKALTFYAKGGEHSDS